MANEILLKQSTQIRFFVTGSFSPADAATNWTVGTPTDVVLTQSALANGAGRQSDKVDLGAKRADKYAVFAAADFTGETPVAGDSITYFWVPSTSTIQANGNVAGNSGADGAAPDGALGSITLAEFQEWCQEIGTLTVHDGAVVQNGYVGSFSPQERYGQMLVVNNAGDAFEADDVENHVVMNPIITEIQ